MARDEHAAARPADEASRRPGDAVPDFGDLRGGPMNHWQVEERRR